MSRKSSGFSSETRQNRRRVSGESHKPGLRTSCKLHFPSKVSPLLSNMSAHFDITRLPIPEHDFTAERASGLDFPPVLCTKPDPASSGAPAKTGLRFSPTWLLPPLNKLPLSEFSSGASLANPRPPNLASLLTSGLESIESIRAKETSVGALIS